MTSYVTPRKNVAYKFYIALVDQSNTKLTKANPTIASGDFKVSTDGGAFANLSTLPSANPASGRAIMIDLSSGEMNGDNVVVQCVDAAGAEWCDLVLNIPTSARQIDDLAFPATTGRSMDTDASGRVLLQPTQPAFTTTSWGGFTSTQLFDIKTKTDLLPAVGAGAANGLPINGNNSGSPVFATTSWGGITSSQLFLTSGYTAPDNTSITGIKAKTDSLTFTVAGQVDSNIQYVNDVQVKGVGTVADPWNPV